MVLLSNAFIDDEGLEFEAFNQRRHIHAVEALP